MGHHLTNLQYPVLSRRPYDPSPASNVCPYRCTFLSGIAKIDEWVDMVMEVPVERVAWMDEQGFQFAFHAEIEDRRDWLEPFRCFDAITTCAFQRPPFTPDWVIHYKMTFDNEVAPIAYAMRWRGEA